MVGEQQLEDALLGPARGGRVGDDLHVGGHGHHAGWLEHRAAAGVDLDHALAAHADRAHARVVAEVGDVLTVPLGRRDDELTLAGHDLATVQHDRDRVGIRLGLGVLGGRVVVAGGRLVGGRGRVVGGRVVGGRLVGGRGRLVPTPHSPIHKAVFVS